MPRKRDKGSLKTSLTVFRLPLCHIRANAA